MCSRTSTGTRFPLYDGLIKMYTQNSGEGNGRTIFVSHSIQKFFDSFDLQHFGTRYLNVYACFTDIGVRRRF